MKKNNFENELQVSNWIGIICKLKSVPRERFSVVVNKFKKYTNGTEGRVKTETVKVNKL